MGTLKTLKEDALKKRKGLEEAKGRIEALVYPQGVKNSSGLSKNMLTSIVLGAMFEDSIVGQIQTGSNFLGEPVLYISNYMIENVFSG